MSGTYAEMIAQITTLEGHSYKVWEYQVSLCQLVIRAQDRKVPKHNIHIVFQGVVYFQMPTFWETGDLRLGSEDERLQFANRIGIPAYAHTKLFKADTPRGPVYILGNVVGILRDVKPIY